ncbi:MAG: amidohydrolase family protein, partial [Bacteroidales bacterium]
MINAHTHLYSGLAALGVPPPFPPPLTFLEVLQRFWWRLDRALDADVLRAAARYYVADAVRHGTTALVDHHESPHFIEGSLDILADACQELGMPAVLCYGVTERNGGRLEGERGLAECQRFIRDNRRPLVRGVVGLHASFTASDDLVRAAGELCREMNSVLHLHVAEDNCDVADARARGYDGVIHRLEALDALPAGSILAHGVHLTRSEVARVSTLGCW